MKCRRTVVSIVAGVALAGAAAAVGLAGVASAATPSPTSSPSPGVAKSNEDATHEAGESTAQEQAEDSGHGGRDSLSRGRSVG